MNKKIIAIDIDDVLVASAPNVIAAYNKRWGTKLTLQNVYAEHIVEAYGGVDQPTALERIYEYMASPEFLALVPTQESIETLRSLKDRYELVALTGRSDSIAKTTDAWIQQHLPDVFTSVSFSNLFHDAKQRSKGELCVGLGASYLIDDYQPNVLSALEHNVQGVLFGNYPWNSSIELPAKGVRCADWSAVMEYFQGEQDD